MAVIFRRKGGTIERTISNARTAGQIEELDSGTNYVVVYTTDIAADEPGEPADEGVFEITKDDYGRDFCRQTAGNYSYRARCRGSR